MYFPIQWGNVQVAGRRMMKTDMISKTVKASKGMGQMQVKLKCLVPTTETLAC